MLFKGRLLIVLGLVLAGSAVPAQAEPASISELAAALERPAVPALRTVALQSALTLSGVREAPRVAAVLPGHGVVVGGEPMTLPGGFELVAEEPAIWIGRSTQPGAVLKVEGAAATTQVQLLLNSPQEITLISERNLVRAGTAWFFDPGPGGGYQLAGVDSAAKPVHADVGASGKVLRISVQEASEAVFPILLNFSFATRAVSEVAWESAGRVLVTPTAWARGLAPGNPLSAAVIAPRMLAEVTALSSAAQGASLNDSAANQLACHLVGAAERSTWNLEPTRPDKGLAGFLASACN